MKTPESPTTKALNVIRVGQVEVKFHLETGQTNGMLTMFEFSVPPNAKVPMPHSHVNFDETAYGLEGSLTWTIGGKKVASGPGNAVFIPRGTVHGFENVGAATARQLSVITPGLLGPDFFREMGEVLSAGSPPDIKRLAAVMQRHGLRPVS